MRRHLSLRRRALGSAAHVSLVVGGIAACGTGSAVVGREDVTAEPSSDGGVVPVFDADGDAGADGAGRRDAGAPTCPPYHSLCAGRCIPTSTDPANCGACAKTCAAGQVCTGGTCREDCLPGAFECGGECVDLKTDSRHCNACGTACGPGLGCVDGTCHPVVALGTAPASCANGGPAIKLDLAGGQRCAAELAQTTFRWAICSCRDVELTNPLVTDAFDSTRGAYAPGQLGGGVGVNGHFTNDSSSTISGTLWASSPIGGVLTSNLTDVRHELHVGGPLTIGNPFTVAGDAYVVGDISASSTLTIGGTLHHPPAAAIIGNVTYGKLARGTVAAPEPCACTSSRIVPVDGIVAARRGTNNDNMKIGLDPNVLVAPNAPRRLELPCGHYYLSKIEVNAPLVVRAMGRTALYVDGDIAAASPLAFVVDPAGELDVFVSGQITTSAKLTIGSPSYPALTRVYVGAVGTSLRITNDVAVSGFVYAARGKIEGSNPVEVFGGVFAGDFRNSGTTTVHYDRQILSAGASCSAMGSTPAPPPPPPDGRCGSCEDCNNQACVNGACGACTSSAQCCAPLVCNNGMCVDVIR